MSQPTPPPQDKKEKEVEQEEKKSPAPESQKDDNTSQKSDNKKEPARQDDQAKCNVYVAGLPKRATEDTLRKTFSRFGSIKSVTIIRDHETNQSRRFAYVLYAEEEAAAQAIKELD